MLKINAKQGYSLQELTDMSGLPKGTIKSRLLAFQIPKTTKPVKYQGSDIKKAMTEGFFSNKIVLGKKSSFPDRKLSVVLESNKKYTAKNVSVMLNKSVYQTQTMFDRQEIPSCGVKGKDRLYYGFTLLKAAEEAPKILQKLKPITKKETLEKIRADRIYSFKQIREICGEHTIEEIHLRRLPKFKIDKKFMYSGEMLLEEETLKPGLLTPLVLTDDLFEDRLYGIGEINSILRLTRNSARFRLQRLRVPFQIEERTQFLKYEGPTLNFYVKEYNLAEPLKRGPHTQSK